MSERILLWIALGGLLFVIHSTVLYAVAWCVERANRGRSPSLSERVWQAAIVLPVLTTAIQLASGFLPGIGTRVDLSDWGAPQSEPNVVAMSERWDAAAALSKPIPAARPEPVPIPFDSLDPVADPSLLDTEPLPVPRSEPATSVITQVTPEPTLGDVTLPNVALEQSAERHSAGTALILGWVVLMSVASLWSSLRLGRNLVRLRRLVRKSTPVESGVAHDLLQELLQTSGLKCHVRLRVSSQIDSPAACGVRRPCILLPAGLTDVLDDDSLGALLRHELGHIARRDLVWLRRLLLIRTLFAFQPLLRTAIEQWRAASEHLADAWAVDCGSSSLSVAECLARVAEWTLARRDNVSTVRLSDAVVSSESGDLVARVERLVDDSASDRWGGGWRKRVLIGSSLLIPLGVAVAAPRIIWATDSVGTLVVRGDPDPVLSDTVELIPEPVATPPERRVVGTGVASAAGVEGVIRSVPEPPAIPPSSAPAERPASDLEAELTGLEAELRRVVELLVATEDDPELQAIAERMRTRLDSLKHRAAALP